MTAADAPAPLLCESCGRSFSLSAAVRARYPGWRPRRCLDCRKEAPGGGGARGGRAGADGAAPSRGGGRGTRSASPRTLAEVLERFTDGPHSGLFTDGSTSGNPGPGGWGVVRVRDGAIVAQRHGAEPDTTNNRMEFTAIIEALSMLRPGEAADIYTDSRLVVDTLTKWARGWQANGWRRPHGGEVANLELVRRAFELATARPRARIQWVRAHDGTRWNEYADALATAYRREEL